MVNIIQAEYLKFRRTFTRRLAVLAPTFFILFALPQKFLMPPDYLRPWQLLLDLVYNWWPVLFIPVGMALLAAMTETQEKKAGNYRSLRAHNIAPAAIWIGKIIVMALHTLMATMVLIAAIVISGLITARGNIPWLTILAGGFTVWVVSLAIIPLQLWVATWKGTVASMIMGVLGLMADVVAAAKPYWLFVPWSWPTRLMCPIIGVHPNGVFLEPGDPLRDPAVIPVGISIALVTAVILTLITALWFNKREVR